MEKPDEEGLKKFMIELNDFNADTVQKGILRLQKPARFASQTRIESFFKKKIEIKSTTSSLIDKNSLSLSDKKEDPNNSDNKTIKLKKNVRKKREWN